MEGLVTLRLGAIPTHSVNVPCGRKPKYPEKTTDFWQSVDLIFSHEWKRIDPATSEVKGERSANPQPQR